MLISLKPIPITILVHLLFMPIAISQELAPASSLGSYAWEAFKVFMSLAVVLIIFYILVTAFKKYTGLNIKNHSTMRVIGGLSLGGKDRVVILEAGDINLLLGISSAGINKLHQFESNEFEKSNSSVNQSNRFEQHISAILGGKNHD